MLIDKCTLILHGVGDATFHYVVTLKDFENDFPMQMEEFRTLLRNVNVGIVGKDYIAKDPQSVDFKYYPTMAKQEIYKRLPYQELPVTKTSWIYDAFTCIGDKFNLKDIMVFVELKYSTMGGGMLWAEIYYVADCLIPAMIIRPMWIY